LIPPKLTPKIPLLFEYICTSMNSLNSSKERERGERERERKAHVN
jgi:hypothetical protein